MLSAGFLVGKIVCIWRITIFDLKGEQRCFLGRVVMGYGGYGGVQSTKGGR